MSSILCEQNINNYKSIFLTQRNKCSTNYIDDLKSVTIISDLGFNFTSRMIFEPDINITKNKALNNK